MVYFQLIGYTELSALNDNWNFDRRLNVNGNNSGDNENGYSLGIAPSSGFFIQMKTQKNLYEKIYPKKNLIIAWRKARKGKTKKYCVKEFEKELFSNIKNLHNELKEQTYFPRPLKEFVISDPKTRKISKADFRDRIVHHALCNVIEPIFDKTFIYDNCANRIGKGNLFALRRFNLFLRKVSRNGKVKGWINNNQIKGYCLKADIKHYFKEIDKNILLEIIKKKIKCETTLQLIKKILDNTTETERERERRTESITRKECH